MILINSDKQFSDNRTDEFSIKLEQLLKTFPDYPYFIIQKHLQAAFKYNGKEHLPVLSFDSVFKVKERISKLEMKQFVEGKVLGIITNKNINEIEAIYYYVNEVDIDDKLYIKLKNALFFVRHKLISEYFDYEHYFEL